MRDVDHIIVGQGLAGTTLAWELRRLGTSVIVIDRETVVTSSRIAAGLITPVTGQRLVKSWRFEELRSAAWEFYRQLEVELDCVLLRETTMLRVFQSPQERDYFNKRNSDPQYAGFLSEITTPPPTVIAPLGCCELHQGGQLRVAEYLRRSREAFTADQGYLAGDLAPQTDVVLVDGGVELPRCGLRARTLVFCEGYPGRSTPWFSNVEFNPARGEMLTVHLPNWTEDRIIHGGVWIAPVNGDRSGRPLHRVGATYDWDRLDSGPTAAGRESLIASLQKLLPSRFEIVDHQTAVRPILKQLNPVLGRHPTIPQLAYFNGLASKGSLQAPYFARMLATHLVQGTLIEREVNLHGRVPWPKETP